MAEIHLAEPKGEPGRKLVIKHILREHLAHPEYRSMFLEEARLNAAVRHKNVIAVFDSGEWEGIPYLALEYVDGLDMRELLHALAQMETRLPLGIAVHIVREVALGLHAAHQVTDAEGRLLKLIHRDVCPHNILIGYDGRVKISDFGIAHGADALPGSRPGQLTGRAGYLSPEQCAGLGIDHRTDIFSLGIVLYEATVGRRLFKGPTRIETQQMIKEARVVPPSRLVQDYPPALERIVMRTLARLPEQRHPDAESLAKDLSLFLAQAEEEVDEAAVGLYLRHLRRSPGFSRKQTATPPPLNEGSAEALPPGSGEGQLPQDVGSRTADTEEEEVTPPVSLDEEQAGPPPLPIATPPETPRPALATPPPAAGPRVPVPVVQPQIGAKVPEAQPGVTGVDPRLERKQPQRPVAISHVIPVLAPEEADDVFYGLDVRPGQVRGRGRAALIVLTVLIFLGVVGYLMTRRSDEQKELYTRSAQPVETATPVEELPKPDATLSVKVQPAEAWISVDLSPVVHRSPAEVPVVSGRSHFLMVQHPGHHPYQTRFTVPQPGGRHLEEITLRPRDLTAEPVGQILVRTSPEGVAIFRGDEPLGQTPNSLSLSAGEELALQLRKEGLTPATVLLTPQNGLESLVRADLAPVTVDGDRFDLSIHSYPDGASIRINGERRGTTPYFERYRRGTLATVRLEQEGYDPYERDVILDGGSVYLEAVLAKQKKPEGQLKLTANQEARVFVGSQERGLTPLNVTLAIGKHPIVMETKKGGKRASFQISLEPGEILERRVVFDDQGNYNVEIP